WATDKCQVASPVDFLGRFGKMLPRMCLKESLDGVAALEWSDAGRHVHSVFRNQLQQVTVAGFVHLNISPRRVADLGGVGIREVRRTGPACNARTPGN